MTARPGPLLEVLAQRPLLCDGAMGTQLIAAGMTPGECAERWNVDRPQDIESIHRRYRQAGCDLLTTNTFGGNGPTLERHGLADQVEALNRAGARLARRVAAGNAWVLGDIGPFGGFVEPLGDTTVEQLQAVFRRQAEALAEGGADAVIVETMTAPEELAVAVRAARQVGAWPILATYAFDAPAGDGGPHRPSNANGDPGTVYRTMMGASAADAVHAAIDAGADVVGANCGTSLNLDNYLHLAEQLLAAAGSTPVIVQPNAGSPRMVEGRQVFDLAPQVMADIVPRLLKLGVRIIGGCCGTSPEHLAAMAGRMPKP